MSALSIKRTEQVQIITSEYKFLKLFIMKVILVGIIREFFIRTIFSLNHISCITKIRERYPVLSHCSYTIYNNVSFLLGMGIKAERS